MIDTSAIIAILEDEPERLAFNTVIGEATARRISSVTRVELTCVAEGRRPISGGLRLEELLRAAQIEVAPLDRNQVEIACEAFRRFGKGRRPAELNIGDCFAYALATGLDEPLLFKGYDFSRTDVRVA